VTFLVKEGTNQAMKQKTVGKKKSCGAVRYNGNRMQAMETDSANGFPLPSKPLYQLRT